MRRDLPAGTGEDARPVRVRRRDDRITWPEVPDDVTADDLDVTVRRDDLRTLSQDNADWVARHLVMVGTLLDDDPETALRHAQAAVSRAGRVAVVREAAGLAAYRCGDYSRALAELRAARRMSGSQEHLPIMADCERGLGRPERALQLAGSREAQSLTKGQSIEMRIVAAGARLDLGEPDAAVVTLRIPELMTTDSPWSARLAYAYADALLAAGRSTEALEWFRTAADRDIDAETDAEERWSELAGVPVDIRDDVDDSLSEGDDVS